MENTTRQKPVHAGHRNRLREKVRKSGLKTLSEHEMIELLLTYAIPRQNTNPLAHSLLNYFGSLSKVIDADYYDLLKVKGVGEESALFLKIISSFIQEYRESKAKEETVIIKNTLDGIKYFRNMFLLDGKELMHVICLSKMGKVVSAFSFEGKNDAEVKFDFKTFMDKINQENVTSIMMFHTHPKGKVEPSYNDLQTTQRCVYISSLMGINFLDHLILNESEHYSMHQKGYIETMKKNSLKLVLPYELDDDLFKVNKSLKLDLKNIDLSKVDFGDVSIEDKIKRNDNK